MSQDCSNDLVLRVCTSDDILSHIHLGDIQADCGLAGHEFFIFGTTVGGESPY